MDIQVVKHTLYPISYLSKDGVTQINTCWGHDPRIHAADGEYYVGEAFVVELIHPTTLPEKARQAKIAELEKELAILKGESHA